jgi:hypothetical protein
MVIPYEIPIDSTVHIPAGITKATNEDLQTWSVPDRAGLSRQVDRG